MQFYLRRIGFCCLVFSFSLCWVHGQHYVFIESDGQPFYVKKAGKLYSSSSNGFLILPKIADSAVAFGIGFPRNQYPELTFEFPLMDRDRAFQLRNLSEKGWVLFDRSSMETIEVGKRVELKKEVTQQDKKGFADVLMEVTGDTTLVSKRVEQKIETKAVASAPKVEVKVDPPVENKQVIVVTNNTVEEKVDIEIDKNEQAIKPQSVKEEVEKARLDEPTKRDRKKDEKAVEVEEVKKEAEKAIRLKADDEKKVNVENKKQEDKKPESNPVQAVEERAVQSIGKSIRSCASPFAGDKDVKALKKKMLGIVSDQDIVDAVIKAMGERCYSCRQLAELSWLFTDEAVRLKLFQRAYAWVADPGKFADLESTLVQDATIAAFRKIMISSN